MKESFPKENSTYSASDANCGYSQHELDRMSAQLKAAEMASVDTKTTQTTPDLDKLRGQEIVRRLVQDLQNRRQ